MEKEGNFPQQKWYQNLSKTKLKNEMRSILVINIKHIRLKYLYIKYKLIYLMSILLRVYYVLSTMLGKQQWTKQKYGKSVNIICILIGQKKKPRKNL